MDKIDICFVVLHYNTEEDTDRFIASVFENIDTDNYRIIVVDNASPNGSGKQIRDKYMENPKIVTLLNEDNLGFAKGNNIGIAYAEKHFDPDFLVMTNSDTYLIQKDFFRQIKQEYQYSHFFVLGPFIKLPQGIALSQGQKRNPRDKKEMLKLIRSTRYHLFVSYCGIADLLSGIRKFIMGDKKKIIPARMYERHEDVYLTGSCLIFSKDYIHHYHGINPSTYMFFEEEILFYEMVRDKRKTVYNPNIKMFHNLHGSTKQALSSKRKRRIFQYRNQLASEKIYLNMIDIHL